MNTYSVEFYDLLARALGANDSKRLQGYLDEVMAAKYNSLQLDGFSFAPEMQLDFTYEQLQREVGLNVMAQYVDLDSPAIPLGTEGAALSTGKIPRMKLVEYLNEDKVRKQRITEERFGISSDRVINSAKDNLFITVDRLIGGHTNSLTYQRHQMVSNGKIVLTDTNNPNGIVGVTLSAHIPAKNVTTLSGTKRWWTSVSDGIYATPGTDCNPVKDMKDMVRVAKQKGISVHFEVDELYAEQICDHPKVAEAIALSMYPLIGADAIESAVASVSALPYEDKIARLSKLVGAPIKTIDSIVSVEKWDKAESKLTRPTFRAFNDNVLVLVPDGALGEVLTVEPISFGGTAGTFYGGRLLLTVGVDYVKKCQSFNTEMTSLVVPDKPQYMWYLHPYSA